MKLLTLFASLSLIFCGHTHAQEQKPEKIKEVIDGNLDEHRAELVAFLKEAKFKPFVVGKDAKTEFQYKKDWVNWIVNSIVDSHGKVSKKDKETLTTALHVYIDGKAQRGYYIETNRAKYRVINYIQRLDESKKQDVVTLLSGLCVTYRNKYLIPLKNHKSINKLGALGQHFLFKSVRDGSCAIHFLKVLDDPKLNNKATQQFIINEAAWICTNLGDFAIIDKITSHEKLPKSSQLVLKGIVLRRKAWEARGTAFAHKVPEENMKKFATTLAEAKKTLLQSYELDKTNLKTIIELIKVNMGLGEKAEMRLWFDRGLLLSSDNPELWTAYRYAMEPKWLGSIKEFLSIGIAASLIEKEGSSVPRIANATIAHTATLLEDPNFVNIPIFQWLLLENDWKIVHTPFSLSYEYASLFGKRAMKYDRYMDLLSIYPILEDLANSNQDIGIGTEKLKKLQLYYYGVYDLVEKAKKLNETGDFKNGTLLMNQIKEKLPRAIQGFKCLYLLDFNNALRTKPYSKKQLYGRSMYSLLGTLNKDFRIIVSRIEPSSSYQLTALISSNKTLQKEKGTFGFIVGLQATKENKNPYQEHTEKINKSNIPYNFIGCNFNVNKDGSATIRITKGFDEVAKWTAKVDNLQDKRVNHFKAIVKEGKLTLMMNDKAYFKDIELELLNPLNDEKSKTKRYGKFGTFILPNYGKRMRNHGLFLQGVE